MKRGCRSFIHFSDKRDDLLMEDIILASLSQALKMLQKLWREQLFVLVEEEDYGLCLKVKLSRELEILQTKILPFMEIKQCAYFEHDGAPCHQTEAVNEWLINSGCEI